MLRNVSRNYSTFKSVDAMIGKKNNYQIGVNGFVKLIDVMPRIVPHDSTCDYAIAQAARVSNG